MFTEEFKKQNTELKELYFGLSFKRHGDEPEPNKYEVSLSTDSGNDYLFLILKAIHSFDAIDLTTATKLSNALKTIIPDLLKKLAAEECCDNKLKKALAII